MNDILKILILASIGGIIGYVTNVVAIKLIFRPIEPIKIPIINKEIIGLIPKRKAEIAMNIGEVIQEEFLSLDEILENIILLMDIFSRGMPSDKKVNRNIELLNTRAWFKQIYSKNEELFKKDGGNIVTIEKLVTNNIRRQLMAEARENEIDPDERYKYI